MFERFTERARQVVVLAQECARDLAAPEIDTIHLLYGLAADDQSVASKILLGRKVTHDDIKDWCHKNLERDKEIAGQIPFTSRAKKCMDLTLREALGIGSPYIGTEHVLLGLCRDPRGTVDLFMNRATNDERWADTLRADTLRLLGATAKAKKDEDMEEDKVKKYTLNESLYMWRAAKEASAEWSAADEMFVSMIRHIIGDL